MKTLNPNTKKAKAFIEAYKRSRVTELYQVYSRHSREKTDAFEWCIDECYNKNGSNLRIISFNTFQFTCAWKVENNLRVKTRDNSYIIPNAF